MTFEQLWFVLKKVKVAAVLILVAAVVVVVIGINMFRHSTQKAGKTAKECTDYILAGGNTTDPFYAQHCQ